MNVTIRLFAGAREAVGAGSLELDVPSGATAGDALAQLVERYAALSRLAGISRLAVNGEYAQPESALAEGDEVAILPPVSGGAE